MMMFIVGLLAMYLFTGILLLIDNECFDGCNSEWVMWLFCWWAAVLTITAYFIRIKLDKIQ